MKLDDTLCYCFHVTRRKVENYLRVHRPRRVSELSQCGGAGTGCGWCRRALQRCFDNAQQAKPAASPESWEQSAEEYAQARQAYIASGKGKPPAGS